MWAYCFDPGYTSQSPFPLGEDPGLACPAIPGLHYCLLVSLPSQRKKEDATMGAVHTSKGRFVVS